MQKMRDVLRGSLGRSLAGLGELDRLTAAWPVACGPTLASRARPLAFAGGVVEIEAEDPAWLAQLETMRPMLERDLARVAGVPLRGIHFSLRRAAR